MPYLLLDSFITFRLNGIEASESFASLQLLLSWALTVSGFVLQVCVGLPLFIY